MLDILAFFAFTLGAFALGAFALRAFALGAARFLGPSVYLIYALYIL
jgi:hypothetical protein